jgi:hypothetical protein
LAKNVGEIKVHWQRPVNRWELSGFKKGDEITWLAERLLAFEKDSVLLSR